MFNAIIITLLSHLSPLPELAAALDVQTFETGEQPCSAMDGPTGGSCSSEYCCTSCRYVGGIWTCWGCSSGNACEGDVFSCAGCYTGGSQCSSGGASNTCCD